MRFCQWFVFLNQRRDFRGSFRAQSWTEHHSYGGSALFGIIVEGRRGVQILVELIGKTATSSLIADREPVAAVYPLFLWPWIVADKSQWAGKAMHRGEKELATQQQESVSSASSTSQQVCIGHMLRWLDNHSATIFWRNDGVDHPKQEEVCWETWLPIHRCQWHSW